MRLGIVTTWFERGAAIVSRQFMDVLTAQGHQVFIYARGGEAFAKGDPKWDLPNVTWNSFRISNIPTDIDRYQFERWLEREGIETVIFNEQQFLAPVLWVKAKCIPTVAYVDYYTKKNISFFSVYDQLWCNTKRHLSACEWHADARYIPWGTDIGLFAPASMADCSHYFFHSAGMSPFRKGTDIFIEALYASRSVLQRLGRKSLIHTQVDLAKALPDVHEKLKELQSNGLLDVIQATIPAPGLYKKGTVYVYPSRLEGIGLTIAEAASSGLYVVTTNEAPMNEFALPGGSALIEVDAKFRRNDEYYWDMVSPSVQSLSEILQGDFVFSDSQIRELAIQHFDFARNAAVLTELLESIKLNPLDVALMSKIDEHDRQIGILLKRRNVVNRLVFFCARQLRRLLK